MPNKLCKVRNSLIHGRGVYAMADIAVGTDVIEYVGEKITKKESTKRALEWEEHARETGKGLVYMFELDEKYDIDGRLGTNPARYMNHSCDPNCEAIIKNGEIWIVACRDLRKGEELFYDYGYDMEHFLDHPCLCGSDNCVGYIVREDQRNKVRKLLKSKRKKRARKK